MTNVAIPPSGTGDSGKVVATETIGGVEFQKVKLFDATPGSTTPLTSFSVSGTVTATGPLTDTQLRATAVPVSGTVTVDTSALATSALQTTGNTLTGIVTETAPGTDTASSGLNGRLQRIAQRLTSLIALLPAALGAGGGLKVDGSGTALPVSGTVTATVGTVTAVTSITNVVHVDDNAGSLTVDGTVAVSGTVTVDTELNAAAALADAASATVSTATVGSVGLVMNATTLDRQRAIIHAQDSAGAGIAAAGMVAEFDDASTAAVTENQFGPVRMSSRRAQLTEGTGPTTATTAGTQVASSATSVTLLSSNALRRGFIFYNGSTSSANVLFGTTASATSFSVFMAPGATYEMVGVNVYSGRIDAIWTTANGNMQVTEW